jgi:hypothetical protein
MYGEHLYYYIVIKYCYIVCIFLISQFIIMEMNNIYLDNVCIDIAIQLNSQYEI